MKNISRLMRSISNRTGPFAFGRVPMMFSFQLEVAKRMVAPLVSFNFRLKNIFLNLREAIFDLVLA